MCIPLVEAVCKLRAGENQEFDDDLNNNRWAGQLPIKQADTL